MTADEKVARLTTALQELEGFASRNQARAKKAVEAAQVFVKYDTIRVAAEARLHEAERVLLVIRDRVREALS